jgi:hypothetical protein
MNKVLMPGLFVLPSGFWSGLLWCAGFFAGKAFRQAKGVSGMGFGCFKKHRSPGFFDLSFYLLLNGPGERNFLHCRKIAFVFIGGAHMGV